VIPRRLDGASGTIAVNRRLPGMHRDRVWEILERSPVGMLTTCFQDGLRARPLDARPNRPTGDVFFVIDVRGLKDDEIRAKPDVCFTVIDADQHAYLSITGRATILSDEALLRKIWKRSDDVWWPDGPQDENVRILRLEPKTADLWDGPANSAVAAFEMSKARLTGDEPDLGENRKVSFEM
jgi:general stress protein 26